MTFLSSADFFSKLIFTKKLFQEHSECQMREVEITHCLLSVICLAKVISRLQTFIFHLAKR